MSNRTMYPYGVSKNSPSVKAVLKTIKRHSADGRCTLTDREIARLSGYAYTTVTTALIVLRNAGLVSSSREPQGRVLVAGNTEQSQKELSLPSRTPKGNPTEQKVYETLKKHSTERGFCVLRNKDIAKIAGLGQPAVSLALTALRAKGVIRGRTGFFELTDQEKPSGNLSPVPAARTPVSAPVVAPAPKTTDGLQQLESIQRANIVLAKQTAAMTFGFIQLQNQLETLKSQLSQQSVPGTPKAV